MIYFYALISSNLSYGLILGDTNLLNYSCTTIINSVHANNGTSSKNKSSLKKSRIIGSTPMKEDNMHTLLI